MIQVEIEKLSLGGAGIARHEGLVLFVPLSVPGDILQVQITEQKKNFAFAEIVQIITPSPHRRAAPCAVFGRCGGCNWQHIEPAEQLRQKELIVREQLSRLISPQTQALPIVASPQEFRYRNRIQVHTQNSKWGYFARKSHDLVETSDCLIAEEALVERLKTFHKNGRFQVALNKKLEVTVSEEQTENPEDLGFSQVNRFQNENLVKTTLDWAEGHWTEIWDLYAGAGNFTFPLAERFRKSKLTAVELSSRSVQSAQDALRAKNVSPQKFKFILSDVGVFLKRARLADDSLVLLDPPRTGCETPAIKALAQQNFKKILYISCNPATLARDLRLLMESSPRRLLLSRYQAFDMFPQTDHVEVLTELIIDENPL